jgi:cytochrome c-type biogenesis protein CcsB
MSTTLHWLTLAAYLLGTGVYLGFVIWQRRSLHAMGRAILWVGLGLHTAALAAAWLETGVLPAMSLRQSLDLFSWAIMGATLVVNLRLDIMILGALSAPLCALLLMAAAVLPLPAAPPSALLKSAWNVIHVLCLLAGYGLLALTCLGGGLYLVQDSLIRKKQLGPLFKRLPSLSRLDSLDQQALVAGFSLLTVGLITGAVYAQITLGSYWRWHPKEVWSLITWLCYAALIHTRLVQGWRGRRGAWLGVAAFLALMFTFVGAGLLYGGYHSFQALPTLSGPLP